MLKKPASCLGCNLYRSGMGFVKPEGNVTNGVYIVGSHNGPNEGKTGTPFVKYAAAGSKLEEVLKSLSVSRNQFRILNTINCETPGGKLENMPFEYPALAHCRTAHLAPELKRSPEKKVILALGNVPLRELTSFKSGGKKENVSALRGYILPSEYGYVIPSYNPAFIKRGKPQFEFYLQREITKALLTARSSFNVPTYEFMEHPSYTDIKSFYYRCKDNDNLPLTYDIETEDSADTEEDERQGLFSNQITRIQFSLERNQAITFPWEEQYFKLIQLLFLLPNPKYGFNSYNFDNPRIRDKGFRMSGTLIDVMWMFKHWKPGLERGLQKVASVFDYPEPWKHLSGEREEWYGCHDVNSLQWIIPPLEAEMKKEGVYGNFSDFRVDSQITNRTFSSLGSSADNLGRKGIEDDGKIRTSDAVADLDVKSGCVSSNNGKARDSGEKSAQIPKGFLGHVVEFWPILDRAKEIGLAVNREKLDRLEIDLKIELDQINNELQELVPTELKNLEPVRKEKDGTKSYGFKKPPRKPILAAWEAYVNIRDNWNGRNSPEDKFMVPFDEFLNSRIAMELERKAKASEANGSKSSSKRYELFCRPTLVGEGEWVSSYFRRVEFKPSSQQVSRYIKFKAEELRKQPDKYSQKLALRYKVPQVIDQKTKQLKESTGSKAMENLLDSTGDEVIRLIIGDKESDGTIGAKAGIRSVQKVLKNDIPNWIPASDGRVHTTWGMVAASGQLDARNPNILNASKHKPLGKIFRRVIEAPEGFVYVEADKKSYHVATMGYAANDADYIRFSQLDPHSYFTAYVAKGVLGLPNLLMSDAEILEICKRYKKDPKWSWVRQNISKVIVLGNQLGLGKRKIFINNNSLVTDPVTKRKVKPFVSMEQVGEFQAMLARMFSKVERFKTEVRRRAHNQGKLVNDFGYKQDFYEVFTWKYDKELQTTTRVQGSESEKAIAFEVQSPAFGDIRDKLLQLQVNGLLVVYPFVVSIHDSFGFMFEREKLAGFVKEVVPILEAPSRVLVKECCPNGLTVGVELQAGRNWQAFHPELNPEGMQDYKF